ncbi:YeeE/YedE thiosulfate transporter family protein [Solemya pervernicosa gill symbiont]|uniref:YeeE/YedE thiosulfate transporter family protein n=1 Tax=Solemya pervernicosa gill symbiont TaxID=642797 RepID=UPI001F3D5AB9|nr:YeeE/YedE thiosulfate transporter family protein [Solemya pervernicosa gill symbiont]
MTNPYTLIITTSLLTGLLAGFIMHRSSFCVTAMFRDIFLFKDGYMMRMLLILVVASMLLFQLGNSSGLLTANPFPLLGKPSLATLVGGMLFGIGMVLAGGCVVGTLYKMGAGSVLSLVAFIGLLSGSALYADLHPHWSQFAKATTLSSDITLPQLFEIEAYLLTLPLALLGLIYIYQLHRGNRLTKSTALEGYIAPWKAALLLALLGFISYLFVGMPFGITTSYAKLGATFEALFLPEHVASLVYFNATPLNYTPPSLRPALAAVQDHSSMPLLPFNIP